MAVEREYRPCTFTDWDDNTRRQTYHRGEEWEHPNRDAIRHELYRLGCTPGLDFPTLEGVPGSTNYTFKGGYEIEVISYDDKRQELLTLPDSQTILLWEQRRIDQ